MEMKTEDFDPYAVLGLRTSCSVDDVNKAARKLGFRYHPDKNPDPAAEVKFLEVQRAKDFLLDSKKRKEYDSKRLAQEKRKHFDERRILGMDDRRKKFKADLERKIHRGTSKSSSSSNDLGGHSGYGSLFSKKNGDINSEKGNIHEMGTGKLSKSDLIKKAKGEMILDELLERRKRVPGSTSAFPISEKGGFKEIDLESAATEVKVKWKRSGKSHSNETLYELFKPFGDIEEIRFTGNKGTSAIISFRGGQQVAENVVNAFAKGDDIRVSLPMDSKDEKKTSIFTHDFKKVSRMKTPSNLSPSSDLTSAMYDKSLVGLSHHTELALIRDISRAVDRIALIKAAEKDERVPYQGEGIEHVKASYTSDISSPGLHVNVKHDTELDELMLGELSTLKNISYEELVLMERSLLAKLQSEI